MDEDRALGDGPEKWLLRAVGAGLAVVALVLVGLYVSSGDDGDGAGPSEDGDAVVPGDAGAPADEGGPDDGMAFVDPEGAYRIQRAPDWEVSDEGPTGVELFLLGSSSDRFTDTVNVVSERTGGASLDDYLEASTRNLDEVVDDIEIEEPERVELAGGRQGALLRYTGASGGVEIGFLVVIAVEGDVAALATLSAEADRYPEVAAAAEPYLRTLQATP